MINVYNTNKLNKKMKIKKKKHCVRNAIFSIGILISVFSFNYSQKDNNTATQNVNNNIVECSTDSIEYSTNTLEDVGYDDNKVSLSESDMSDIRVAIDNTDVNYEYSNLYNIDRALEIDKKNLFEKKTHTSMIDLVNNKFDSNVLYNVIEENNKKYLSGDEISAYKRASYKELSSSKMKEYCDIITNTLNSEIKRNSEIDVDELRCVVGNIKMFSSPTTSIAYVSDDDVMVVSPNMVKVSTMIKKSEYTESDVLIHETEHLIQKSCKDNINNKTQVGVSKRYDTLDVNPLEWKWFYEATAENGMINNTGHEATTYKTYLSYLKSLMFSVLLDKDVKLNDLSDINLQKDDSKIYEIFNCENEKDKKELIEMMYSIDIIQSQREDFADVYLKSSGNDILKDEDKLIKLQRNLKVSVCESLTKYFYENLSLRVNAGGLTFSDMFFLIRTFEGDLNSHLDCFDKEKYGDNKNFIQFYLNIQNKFFKELADSLGTDIEKITSLYSLYEYGKNDKLFSTFDLDEKEFILNRADEVILKNKYSIRKLSEIMDENRSLFQR